MNPPLLTVLSPPENVVTRPSSEMARIRLLPESATKSTPSDENASPRGLLNKAFVPKSSANPRIEPANVTDKVVAITIFLIK
jgi:hypothetical protein